MAGRQTAKPVFLAVVIAVYSLTIGSCGSTTSSKSTPSDATNVATDRESRHDAPTAKVSSETISTASSTTLTEKTESKEQSAAGKTVTEPDRATPDPLALPAYSAGYLIRYADKEVPGEGLSEGRRIVVDGRVATASTGTVPYILLFGRGSRGIICTFAEGEAKSVAGVHAKQQVQVAGTCSDLTDDPSLKDCELVSSTPPYELDEWHNGMSIREAIRIQHEKEKESREQAEKGANEARARDKKNQELARAEAERIKAAEEAKYHKWTSLDGKFTTEAKLLSYANGTITIQSRDGTKKVVPLEKITEADREYIAAWRKERQ